MRLGTKHSIRSKKRAIPVAEPIQRKPPEQDRIAKEEVRKRLGRQLIESSSGAVHLIRKNVAILRQLSNGPTIPDAYPLPNIEEMLGRLQEACFF